MTNNDARRSALEAAVEGLPLDRLDGCDLITVLMIVLDAEGTDLYTVMIDEPGSMPRYVADIIHSTQSNSARAWNLLRRFARLDEAISRLDD